MSTKMASFRLDHASPELSDTLLMKGSESSKILLHAKMVAVMPKPGSMPELNDRACVMHLAWCKLTMQEPLNAGL